ncbi:MULTISPECIES: SMP-30/gluconolactonase/LRE family protein [unclassified Sphingobacterium]|uniref:SMP-30/gluconolactonase/LRE family protein n=1 Tax=unclassified Sphingobacterium TaxID=2609468 RepID=UPI0010EA41E6|nr:MULTISPECIES: SMP-30/gluconolactonase/LRE family protein [unclassified Sphingobacterium]MCS3552763.1 gluconolactonase [Sphingobacterium sp. JUb21]TCR10479.1 gluconolactonase [Sphingobacterium sp. JUb20]
MKINANHSILLEDLQFPEGPAFDKKGTLWFVEQLNGSISEYNNGILTRHLVGGRPNGIAIDQTDLIWFCDSLNNEIRTYNPATSTVNTIVSHIDGMALNLPNDLAFDELENLVFTCSGEQLHLGDGYCCARNRMGKLVKIETIRFYPNGLAFSKDGRHLYLSETGTQRIWKGNWDSKSLTWNNPEVFTETGGPVGPDGMAFDELGRLYVAVFGSSSIHVYDHKGNIDQKIKLSGANPTNCAFDPINKLGLIITEAEKGQLLSYKTDLKGIV